MRRTSHLIFFLCAVAATTPTSLLAQSPTVSSPAIVTAKGTPSPAATITQTSLADRVNTLETATKLENRIQMLEHAKEVGSISSRVERLESISKLAKRLDVLESGDLIIEAPWWSDWTGLLKLIIGGGVFTFILGLLKERLDRSKFEHERNLALLQHRDLIRREHLTRVLDPNQPIEQRVQLLRYLRDALQKDEDSSLKEWARLEVSRYEGALGELNRYYEKQAEIEGLREQIKQIEDALMPDPAASTAVEIYKRQKREHERDVAAIKTSLDQKFPFGLPQIGTVPQFTRQ